jgi:hypothetical protein
MRSVALREACGVVRGLAREGGVQGVPSLSKSGRRPWKRCRAWIAAVMDSPAYGARNVSMVAAGTGEALPGPADCGVRAAGARCPITGDPGKWMAGRVGVGGGRSTG